MEEEKRRMVRVKMSTYEVITRVAKRNGVTITMLVDLILERALKNPESLEVEVKVNYE